MKKMFCGCTAAVLAALALSGCIPEGAVSGDPGISADDVWELVKSLGKQVVEKIADGELPEFSDTESKPEYSDALDNTQWQLYAVKNSDGIHQVFKEETDGTLQLLYPEMVYIDFYGASDLALVRYQFPDESYFDLLTEHYTYHYFERSERASQPAYSQDGKYEIYDGCENDTWYIAMQFSGPGSFLDGSSSDYEQYYDYEEFRYRTDDPDWPFTFGEEERWYATVVDDHMEVARYTVQYVDGQLTRSEEPHTVWYLYDRLGEVPQMPE